MVLFLFFSGVGTASAFPWSKSAEVKTQVNAAEAQAPLPAPPGSLADLAKRLSPSVVNVKVIKVEKSGQFPMPDGPFGHFFRQFPNMIPESRPMQGAGSGVIISENGEILTNNHVVEGAKEVTVTLADKEEYTGQIIGGDPKTDLAIIKISPKRPLHAAVMGNSDQLQVGEWVMAVGNPFGLSHTVTSGIVSAKGRTIGAGPYDNFIQTDASINPGNSGGPLYNMRGELVGINTAIIAQGQGIGFAIPINTAKPLIPQLITKGEVTRGYIGVSIQPLTQDLSRALGLRDETKGVLVAGVTLGGPAEKAGIRRSDVIVSFNGKPVEEPRDLSSLVAESPAGKEAVVTVLREGKKQDLKVAVGTLSQSEKKAETGGGRPASGKWGLMLQDMNAGESGKEGVAVAGVQTGTPAERAGIREGDIILEVNRHQVNSAGEAAERMKDSESLLLLLQRNDGSFYVVLSA
ncbi:MAG: DegQ family serine endoprotease [Desulfobacteraceae bacterium]|nr:MAG: DegQ family serine endoprotease [Desulfobacteraceae bacterium]